MLVGTALVSAALLGAVGAPAPAAAQVLCTQPAPPAPIIDSSNAATIVCLNTEPRTNAAGRAIDLTTTGPGNSIQLENSGLLTGSSYGARGLANGTDSVVTITNTGEVDVDVTGFYGRGLASITVGDAANGGDSSAGVLNLGDIDVDSDNAGGGIRANAIGNATNGARANATIDNSGDVAVDSNNGIGLNAATDGNAAGNSSNGVFIGNSGDVTVTMENEGFAIRADAIGNVTDGSDGRIVVDNTGVLTSVSEGQADGIYAIRQGQETGNSVAGALVENAGDIYVDAMVDGFGVRVLNASDISDGSDGSVEIYNSGDLDIQADRDGRGLYAIQLNAIADESDASVSIHNSGDVEVAADGYGRGIVARAFGSATDNSDASVTVKNAGALDIDSLNSGYGISASVVGGATNGSDKSIEVHNTGNVEIDSGNYAEGISVTSVGEATGNSNSRVSIANSGDMDLDSSRLAYGINVFKTGDTSDDSLGGVITQNTGDFRIENTTASQEAAGIGVSTIGANNPVGIENSGAFRVNTFGDRSAAKGIDTGTRGDNSRVKIRNSGYFRIETEGNSSDADGIEANSNGPDSNVTVHNSGDFLVKTRGEDSTADGIDASTYDGNSNIEIWNSGNLIVETLGEEASADGIDAYTEDPNSTIEVRNSGNLTVTASGYRASAGGIDAQSDDDNSKVEITNSGELRVEAKGAESAADGIDGDTFGNNSRLKIDNSGDMWVTTAGDNSADGIDASTNGDNSGIEIHNSGDMTIEAVDGGDNSSAGIEADTGSNGGPYGPYLYGTNSGIKVVNSGNIDVTTGGDGGKAEGIGVETEGTDAKIEIHNSGDLHAEAKGASLAAGINADSYGVGSPIDIHNSGSAYAEGGYRNIGIRAFSTYANKTTITNTGTVGAESHRAIDVKGAGTAHIDNAGTVTGFVDLTSQGDVFNNQSGGVFETKLTSFFGAGDDLFTNRSGGTVLAATDGKKTETSFFEGLETFKNAGLISMVDAKEGDAFTISNTPGGTDLDYKGGGTLGVDSFLGGPGSKSDTFTIEGNVSGKTKVAVYNTNPGGGAFNAEGIPVVFATGETPDANAFRLQDGPIDAGLFDYDLFFEGGGSGQWELRSFAGGGAHLLPQLLTAAQDIWHQSSSTWFDRTADLRVLMHGGPAPLADGSKSLGVAPVQDQLAPAVWLKGGGSWLDRDATASTSAYGRNYKFNLDRELETVDIQVGIDFASRDVMGAGDALVFGMLGGFVHGDLDYDSLARRFTYSGGQVGAYATYLSGGLFVDTLLNVHLTELDTNTRGVPGSLDANTVGLRTDAGYRFGSFSGGAFIEPLGTIEVMWADIDGFSQDGNRVSFDDDANVRGRLGLRAGTTSEVWEGTLMEPFIIGSLWSHLSGDNQATLVSSGRKFQFQDNLEDVWGEVSAGVNFINFSQTTSVFGKVDVTFGDDISGVGGKAGMRVVW